jgi:hypothetical protein
MQQSERKAQHKVAMNAVAVAMSAKAGTVELQDVIGLQVRAEELLDHGDPLFRAVCRFTTDFDMYRYARSEWPRMGTELHQAVDVAITPTPPDMDRRDIHG